jgi:fatty-acyl-CoA synthase
MIDTLQEQFGVRVMHSWGMTEMSPIGTLNALKEKHQALPLASRRAIAATQGRLLFGVDMKIIDDAGNELPRDGHTFGNLMVKGPWICRRYFNSGDTNILQDGWFPTGDVATIDADGYLRITDRGKDVIKSGGEWISSIELENCAVGHPGVAEAAVIGVNHVKWGERPLLLVVRSAASTASREDILNFLAPRFAKWWLPDDVLFVDALPHTASGKLLKTRLREQYCDHLVSGVG